MGSFLPFQVVPFVAGMASRPRTWEQPAQMSLHMKASQNVSLIEINVD